ncbi:porin [Methylibium petroleiphilum]
MKKILSLALLTTLAAPVLAQSSVTIAGVADAAARSVNNQGLGSIKSLVSGANSTSRLIVRGVEDLGGGLSAGFWLEHGIALDTGLPTGGFWDRRATVSLSSKGAGELRLGRDFVPSYLSWNRYDPFAYVGAAGSTNAITGSQLGPIRNAFGTGANTTVRSSDAIQYWLPAGLGGLEGNFMVAAGEGTSNKVLGGRLGYGAGKLYLSAAHTVTENANTASGKFTDTALGGSYDFGVVRVSAVNRQFKQANAKQTNLMLAATVPVGTGEFKASYIRVDMAGRASTNAAIDANDANQMALGYVYNLSRRSALYATWVRFNNDGAATYVVPGGPAGLAGGKTSTGYEAGLRHNF